MKRKLPEGWEWKKIQDISFLTNGRAFKPSDWGKSGIPIVRIQNLNDDTAEFNYYNGQIDDKNIINNGELLFAWSGTPGTSFGAHIWRGGKAALNQHIFKMKIDSAMIQKEYLMYAINHYINSFINQAHGSSGLAHITKDRFEKTEVPIPPLATQRTIVSILDKAEKIKRLRAQVDELNQKLLQSIFLGMFGDPIENRRNWTITSLGDVLTGIVNGLYVPNERYVTKEGVHMVHMTDAFCGIVRPEATKTVKVTKAEVEKYRLTSNDLLIARRSLNYEGAAKPCRIPQCEAPLIFESSLIKISLDLKKINPTYLYFYLSNESVRQSFVYKNITRSTISGINQDSLKKIKLLLPPIELQLQFCHIVSQQELFQQNLDTSSANLRMLWDSLMNKMFTGELIA